MDAGACEPTEPSPWTRLTTPGGSAVCIAATAIPPESGATSDGLTTTVLPAMSAGMQSKTISSTG